jgi:hypothetical protein
LVALACALGLTVLGPRGAFAQNHGSLDVFGGRSLNEVSTSPDAFGGRLTVNLTPGIQVLGEVGRIGNMLPAATNTLISLTPLDVKLGATYAEGGIRLSAARRSPIHPYVEASAGVARLNIGVTGLGTTGDAIARAALGFVTRTDPIAGAGGGVVIQGGPLRVDLGYRYKQILADDVVTQILGAGDRLRTHQARVAIGVRF